MMPAAAVDDVSPNSLFWKVDFILARLPGWMARGVTRRSMFVGFATGSEHGYSAEEPATAGCCRSAPPPVAIPAPASTG